MRLIPNILLVCGAVLSSVSAFLGHGSSLATQCNNPTLGSVALSQPQPTPHTKLRASQDNDLNLTPEEWEARKRLARDLTGGFKQVENPVPPKETSLEEEQTQLSDEKIAAQLRAALSQSKNRDARKKANEKIVDAMFDEAGAKLKEEGERLKAEFEEMKPRLEAEANERMTMAEVGLLSDIDQQIRAFKATVPDVTRPLGSDKSKVVSEADQAVLDLESKLSKKAAAPVPATPTPVSQRSEQINLGATAAAFGLADVADATASEGTGSDNSSKVVLVGRDGLVGAAIMELLDRDSMDHETIVGVSADEAVGVVSPELSETLKGVGTLILACDEAKKGLLQDTVIEALLGTCGPSLRHVIALSTLAKSKGGGLFGMSSASGGSDQKGAEQALVRRSRAKGFDHTIIRVGKLRETASKKSAVQLVVGEGEQVEGETTVDVASGAVLQAMTQAGARNATASLVGSTNPLPEEWDDQFLRLVGPELLRIPLSEVMGAKADAVKAAIFIREWSQRWSKPGSGLTTPVEVTSGDNKVKIVFKPTTKQYLTSKEEKALESRRESGKGGGLVKRAGKKEGGLEIIVETEPYPRVRVVRCEMDEGTVVKEMSEKEILGRLRKELKTLSQL